MLCWRFGAASSCQAADRSLLGVRQGASLEASKFLLDLLVTPGPPTAPHSASPLLSLSPPAGAILGLPVHLPPNTEAFQLNAAGDFLVQQHPTAGLPACNGLKFLSFEKQMYEFH